MSHFIKLSDIRYTELETRFDDVFNNWITIYLQSPELPSAAIEDVQESMKQLLNVLLAPLLIEKLQSIHGKLQGPFQRVGTKIFTRNVALEHMRDLIQVRNYHYFHYWTELNFTIKQFVQNTFLFSPEIVLAHVNLPFIVEFDYFVRALRKQVNIATAGNFMIKTETGTSTRFLCRTVFGYPITITASIGIFLNRDETGVNSFATWIGCPAELPQRELNDSFSLPPSYLNKK